MALYVCFNDSVSDPTYTGVDSAILVESYEQDSNPCSVGKTKREVPIMPRSISDIEDFAAIMGWSVETDNNGQVILYTGMQKLVFNKR